MHQTCPFAVWLREGDERVEGGGTHSGSEGWDCLCEGGRKEVVVTEKPNQLQEGEGEERTRTYWCIVVSGNRGANPVVGGEG